MPRTGKRRRRDVYSVTLGFWMSSSLFQFAEVCDALAATTKKLEKRAIISNYLRGLSVEDAARAALYIAGTPFSETDSRALSVGGSLLSRAVSEISQAS